MHLTAHDLSDFERNAEVYGSVRVVPGLVTNALNSFVSLAAATRSILQTLVQSSQGNLLSQRALSPGHFGQTLLLFLVQVLSKQPDLTHILP